MIPTILALTLLMGPPEKKTIVVPSVGLQIGPLRTSPGFRGLMAPELSGGPLIFLCYDYHNCLLDYKRFFVSPQLGATIIDDHHRGYAGTVGFLLAYGDVLDTMFTYKARALIGAQNGSLLTGFRHSAGPKWFFFGPSVFHEVHWTRGKATHLFGWVINIDLAGLFTSAIAAAEGLSI